MANQHEIKKSLQRLEKFNDPVLLMMIILLIPAVIMVMIFSSIGEGTMVKVVIAICFLFFTWLAVKVNSFIKQRIETLQSQLKEWE